MHLTHGNNSWPCNYDDETEMVSATLAVRLTAADTSGAAESGAFKLCDAGVCIAVVEMVEVYMVTICLLAVGEEGYGGAFLLPLADFSTAVFFARSQNYAVLNG